MTFLFEIIWGPKIVAQVLMFWNSNLSNNLDGKTTKTEVVDLDKNYDFVVDDFFIWSRLGS